MTETTQRPADRTDDGRRIAVRAGNYQSARARRPFSAQLAAFVCDRAGRPVAGAYVTFRVGSGPATFGRGSRVATARTGPNGLAVSAVVVAGETGGSVQVTASTALAPRPASYTLRVIDVVVRTSTARR